MKPLIFLICLSIVVACSNREPKNFPVVKYAGALRNVTELGDSSSHIYLDTILPHRRLYAIGALKGLSGQILVIDGRPYSSKLNSNGRNKIKMNFDLEAPWLVYAHVRDWQEVDLPSDSIITNESLGKHIEKLARERGIDVGKPFPFMLGGSFRKLDYHIDYLMKKNKNGNKKRPETHFSLNDPNVIIVGFFSKHHQNIFTEPGSNVVMGFMTTTASQIGQIDQLTLKGKKVQLLLPE
jgi:acetolactate decarboxylase